MTNNTTHTANANGTITVSAEQCRIIEAVRVGYRFAAMLPHAEDRVFVTRGLRTSWYANNLENVRMWLDTIAELLGDVVGAYDAVEALRAASSSVLRFEMLAVSEAA